MISLRQVQLAYASRVGREWLLSVLDILHFVMVIRMDSIHYTNILRVASEGDSYR